jgi:hypothetical protein
MVTIARDATLPPPRERTFENEGVIR